MTKLNYQLMTKFYDKHLNGWVFDYRHQPSGARILHLQNEDPHKTFGVAFKTHPKDSTGLAHILEHAVLNGSRKFTTKEPFVDLLKSSMNTFLNAMTASDMTYYPISSMVDQDFFNLVDVYLDAVFFPKVLENPLIFAQEGYHFIVDETKKKLDVSGVVYNEMKGVYSSSDNLIMDDILMKLHPGSTYSVDSGGNPSEIWHLTYQDLCTFHKTYYHPDNALFVFYGNMDMDPIFDLLEKDYLSYFKDRRQVQSIQKETGPMDVGPHFLSYPASPSQVQNQEATLSYAFTTGLYTSEEDQLVSQLLAMILVDMDSALLRKAFEEAKLGQDIFSVQTGSYYLDFAVVVKKSHPQDLDRFVALIEKTLTDAVKQGLDPNLVQAAFNKVQLSDLEETLGHRGLNYFFNLANRFRYQDSQVLDFFKRSDLYKSLKEKLDQGLLEEVIRTKILDNPYKQVMVHQADDHYFDKLEAQDRQALDAYYQTLTDQDRASLLTLYQDLKDYQNRDDSPKEKASIPRLHLNQIPLDIEPLKSQIIPLKDGTLFFHQEALDLVLCDLWFDLGHLTDEELFQASILSYLLTSVDTKAYSYDQLDQAILLKTGGISAKLIVVPDKEDKPSVKMAISSRALVANQQDMLALLAEVLCHSQFTQKDRIKQLLTMVVSRFEMGLQENGTSLALGQVKAGLHPSFDLEDRLMGLSFYRSLKDYLLSYEQNPKDHLTQLTKLLPRLFRQDKLLAAWMGPEIDGQAFEVWLQAFGHQAGDINRSNAQHPWLTKAIYYPAQVVYVGLGSRLSHYHGAWTVLSQLVSYDLLHSEIRAKNGAYGAGMGVNRQGDVLFYSYRDPHIQSTLTTMRKAAEYLSQLNLSPDDLEAAIIGVLMQLKPVVNLNSRNSVALRRHVMGVSDQDLRRAVKEAVSLTPKDLPSYGQALAKALENAKVCVCGSYDMIDRHADLFETIEGFDQ